MNARRLLPAVLLLATPLAYSQMGPGPGGPPMYNHGQHHEGGPEGGHGMWWNKPEVVARLALTPDQQKKIEDIFVQSRVQLIDLHASLEKEQLLLGPLMDTSPLDQPKALAQIDKIADTRASLEKTNAKMLLSIRGVLTPEQWTKLQAHRGDLHHGDGGPMGGRGGPDGHHFDRQQKPVPPPAQ
jgi:Spy/CpxP family protein refolding chaperone